MHPLDTLRLQLNYATSFHPDCLGAQQPSEEFTLPNEQLMPVFLLRKDVGLSEKSGLPDGAAGASVRNVRQSSTVTAEKQGSICRPVPSLPAVPCVVASSGPVVLTLIGPWPPKRGNPASAAVSSPSFFPSRLAMASATGLCVAELDRSWKECGVGVGVASRCRHGSPAWKPYCPVHHLGAWI